MRVSSDMPDDVIVLHDALEALREHKKGEPLTLNLKNCGTALRFLQVHLAKCYPDEPITLDGDPRLKERDGQPTSQTDSARLMHGEDIPYSPDESPYLTMTRRVMEKFEICNHKFEIEADWSSASYWYEYVAIHGGELLLEGLTNESMQGDRIVADIYAKHFGVETVFTPQGVEIKANGQQLKPQVEIDFSNIPDLYPAIALTCERLSIQLLSTGTERLRFKESDRLEAVRLHEVRNDHRIAMALLAADFPVSKEDQQCISKSYPSFTEQFSIFHFPFSISHITPIKGVNDDNLGKKYALSKLIHATNADYVWLHDDDVELPEAATKPNLTFPRGKEQNADLIILPLRMQSKNDEPSLLEKLQIAEYAAIQELTMMTAKKGKPVMCSGANLIIRREAWLACEPDIHPEIPSGDDMFLLEAAKRRGMKIGVLDEPDFTAIVLPQTTWRAFWHQRMRWAGKAPHYTDRDIRRCGALVLTANLLQILCPPIILIKFPIEYALIRRRTIINHKSQITNTKPQTLWPVALLLEIIYPFYLIISLLGGLSRQREW